MTGRKIYQVIKHHSQEEKNKLFENLYNEYFRLLYFVSFNYLKNEQIVEDIVEGVFVNFFQKCHEREFILNVKNVKAYLCACARHESLKEKKSLLAKEQSIDIENTLSKTDSIPEIHLQNLLQSLNEDEIEIVIEHVLLDLSFREISEKRNVPLNTLKSKYRRTIFKLRLEINNEK